MKTTLLMHQDPDKAGSVYSMINLNSISAIEFQNYFKATTKSYAEHNIDSGRWAKENALRLAEAELDVMLPNGLETPNNHIYIIESQHENIPVGYLWVAVDEGPNEKSMFICDVEIHEVFRRKGYAEATFHFVEKHARSLGITVIRANIFGHNKKALALSKKLGYQTTNVIIAKQLC